MQITRSFFSGHQAQLGTGPLDGTRTNVRPPLRSGLGLASVPIIIPRRPLVSFRCSLPLAPRSTRVICSALLPLQSGIHSRRPSRSWLHS